jgi:hypothetical protein
MTAPPRRSSSGLTWCCNVVVVLMWLALANQVRAQSPAPPNPVPPNPHQAQPERPSVATHAFTVATGWVELETGAQRQRMDSLSTLISVPVLFKIGLGEKVQLDVAPGWQRASSDDVALSGVTDLGLGVKWRVVDRAPVLGAFAVQAWLVWPTGSVERGTGTGEAALNLLAISSHTLHGVAVDVNVGYTRRGGDGIAVSKHSTVWAISSGLPVAGPVGIVAELFGLPGSAGPAGAPPVVGFLTGPTIEISPSVVLDAGAIFSVSGFGGTAIYAGVTWNMGRAWGAPPRSQVDHRWRVHQ